MRPPLPTTTGPPALPGFLLVRDCLGAVPTADADALGECYVVGAPAAANDAGSEPGPEVARA